MQLFLRLNVIKVVNYAEMKLGFGIMQKILISVGLFLLFVEFGFAQSEIKKVLNLNECIEIALQRNYDIQINEAKIAAAGAGLTNAFGQYLPTMGFDMSYNKTFKDNIKSNYSMGLGRIGKFLMDLPEKQIMQLLKKILILFHFIIDIRLNMLNYLLCKDTLM